MGKQNNNFEYYKPQNGNSFVPSDSDSDDCKDSDSKAMFTLPRRKVLRSKGSSRWVTILDFEKFSLLACNLSG